jgi:hypothetical protein
MLHCQVEAFGYNIPESRSDGELVTGIEEGQVEVNNLRGEYKQKDNSRRYQCNVGAGPTSGTAWIGVNQRGLDGCAVFPVEEAAS